MKRSTKRVRQNAGAAVSEQPLRVTTLRILHAAAKATHEIYDEGDNKDKPKQASADHSAAKIKTASSKEKE